MTDKPRVLLLSTNSDEAGAPLHVETLVRHLAGDVDFFLLFGEDGPVFRRLREAGFDARLLPDMRSAVSPRMDLISLRRLTGLIREIRPDLIHCHSSKAGLLGRIAGRWCGVPVLFTVHGWSWASVSGRKARLALAVERMVARLRGVHFLYVGKAVEEAGRRRLGLRPGQGRVIGNGVGDLGVAPLPPPEPVTFIMPARAAYPKDHETVVRAFEALSGDARLILCGAGTETPDFAALVRRWAPVRHGAVACLGHRSDIPGLLHGAHVMVLSSHSEAMPLSVIEAMSAGLPVIASDVGGIPELVTSGWNGVLVPPADPAALASAMTELLDPARRAAMGRNSRARYAAGATAAGMALATLGYYRDIVAGRA